MTIDRNPAESLGPAVRVAYPGPDCPPAERYLAAAMGELDAAEAARLEAHAESCPACAAERDLARAFAAPPEAVAGRRDDVDFVVARLRGTAPAAAPVAPARKAGAEVVPFPRRFGIPAGGFRRLAAAAALILAAGLGGIAIRELGTGAPPLPAPPPGGTEVVRGGEIAGLAPAGDVATPPTAFAWQPVAGASRYRVTLLAVDDARIWQGEAASPPIDLPAEVAAALQPGVVYFWTVEALDGAGQRLAGSERVRFHVAPVPESPVPPGPAER